jgi:hypothetical protein
MRQIKSIEEAVPWEGAIYLSDDSGTPIDKLFTASEVVQIAILFAQNEINARLGTAISKKLARLRCVEWHVKFSDWSKS